jgi:RNA polymerase sigma-70 factor, ECF subfamily
MADGIMVVEINLVEGAGVDFDAVFVAHYAPLVRSVTMAIGNHDLAVDAVQEAFARAAARWTRVSRYRSPIGWIRTVAINSARDHARRQARFDRIRHLLATPESIVQTEWSEPLDGALRQLSPQQRITATLHYLDDLPITEIAAIMRLSEGTVKFHLHAAREQLRSLIDPAS